MHIPNVEKGISELARVITPGGTLIVSEGNMYSLQSMVFRFIKQMLNREKAEERRTKAGLEFWNETPAGLLLTRHADIGELISVFGNNGFELRDRLSGQFTEIYTRISNPLAKRMIHLFNHLWFKFVRNPYLSFGKILILEKKCN